MFALSKILSFLISPFNLAVLLALGALFLPHYRKKLLIATFVILIVFSNSLLFRLTIGMWEDAPQPLVKNNQSYQNVVILGGLSAQHEPSGRVKFSSSSDRLLQALILSKQNPVKRLVISGGNASIVYDKRPEGAYLKEFLGSLGWEMDDILIDSLSRNTHENALNTRQLFVDQDLPLDIVLVTSAWHMPRARRCFEKQGFKVLPVHTDFLRPMGKITPDEFILPSAGTLSAWDLLFKEWTGLVYYKLRGYI